MGKLTANDIHTLTEIYEQINDLTERAVRIVQRGPRNVYEPARAYWIPHIKMALNDDHNFLGSDGCTFERTLNDLRNQLDPNEGLSQETDNDNELIDENEEVV